jgi:hypothetical protein
VFHVSQLKEYRPDYTPVFADLPNIPMLDTAEPVPERILDRRMVKKGGSAITQVLIKWTGISEDSATWEDWTTLVHHFPSVLAWGQASSAPEGTVTQTVVP